MFGYSNDIVRNDLREITQVRFPWFDFEGKTILVTGANGMLATYLIYTFLYLVREKGINIKVVALSRSLDKTRELYKEFLNDSSLVILHQDVCSPITYVGRIDYIYHFAGNASPYYIKNDPLGIIKSNIIGTFNVMELARDKEPQKVIFASTREVYGETSFQCLSEDSFGKVDPLDSRSCYPESKRAAETIIKGYVTQYGINSVIARIAHSYGPGMKTDNDGRVMSDFIHSALHSQDITLLSDGSAVRSFCYINDVILGLFQLTLFGKKGEAYNLANETEPMPIREIARMIADTFPEKGISVNYKQDADQSGYCAYQRVALDTRKIEDIGFKPSVSLREGIKRTILSFE